ncbi:hypothetical protein LHJ74_06745 [Streptomyces sp. N2-109]|uniref:Integral membrane protein n=1 Tax=Streptomyces gossypii TaxID=2883101 RepID=A0ABT2JQ26_9ACTN|nr:hypothetical protein [Streptomyces gossypii]MCT2589624.1 hypothetical protein [Streptomyces gossypii]
MPLGTVRPVGAEPGYVGVGSMALPQWLLWVLAVLLVAGGVTAYGLVASSDSASDSASHSSSGSSQDPAGAAPSASSSSDGKEEPEEPAGDPTSVAPGDVSSPEEESTPEEEPPSEPEPSPSSRDASAVVRSFYGDINDENYSGAWELGGKNIAGTSYQKWVDGYDTTAIIELSAVNTNSAGEVSAVLRATQNDGSVQVYRGTYTVENGVIVSADITQS